MPQNKDTSQNGNAILFILIAVFLFGALAFSFTRSARDGSSNISKQQAKIAAQEIINYARIIESAVNRVRRNGCSEIEISFENSIVTGYTNPNSPLDKTCHIFEAEGGKAAYLKPNKNWIDESITTGHSTYRGEWVFTGSNSIDDGVVCPSGAVSGCADLMLAIPYLKKDICISLSQMANSALTGDGNPIEEGSGFGLVKFLGSYLTSPAYIDGLSTEYVCYNMTNISFTSGSEAVGDLYTFVYMLLDRN